MRVEVDDFDARGSDNPVSSGCTVKLTLETRVPAAELSKDRVVGLVHGTISAFEKGFGIKSTT